MSLKVAVVQAAPVFLDLAQSLEKIKDYVSQARTAGAQLVLFPESFLPCYPRGLDFGAVVGSRSSEGRAYWQEYYEKSMVVPGSCTELLGQIAAGAGIFLVIGITEKAPVGGTLYCSLLYFSPQGELLLCHRKIKPTASERIIWGEGDGKSLRVINTPLAKMGGLICWENYMPLARMALYQQGIQLYLAPTADSRDSWQATLAHIACEGRCYVLGANQFVKKEDYPPHWQTLLDNPSDILCRGGSAIYDPMGKCIAEPLYNQEGILHAECYTEEITKAHLDLDVAGHYARPDLFKFDWNRS